MDKQLKHNILDQPSGIKQPKKQEVNLYSLAGELYSELESRGMFDRLKKLNQLGPIFVKKKMRRSRYDYMMLQLYLHQITSKLGGKLPYSYNSSINKQCLSREFQKELGKLKITMADVVQLLTISYNLGHFYNTFSSSRALLILAKRNTNFVKQFKASSSDHRFQEAFQTMLNDHNYKKIHLLNSILVLERCDQNKASVKLAIELLYQYLKKESLEHNEKLHLAFDFFHKVRDVSYIAYDTQIATTPFRVDLFNKQGLANLLSELLEEYNDGSEAHNLIHSMDRMLDASLYNKKDDAIAHYRGSWSIYTKAKYKTYDNKFDYYEEFWVREKSVFNEKYKIKKDFHNRGILKLTFNLEEKDIGIELLNKLETMNNIRVGYYERREGEQTILVAMSKKCKRPADVSLRVLQNVISYLRKLKLEDDDHRYLLVSKFFLYNLFNQHQVTIDPTIHLETCVFCTMGKRRRINRIEELIENPSKIGTVDDLHEVEFMKRRLEQDHRSDITITIPGSIKVYDENKSHLCEFDGLIIYPNRKDYQLTFLEAKNTKSKPEKAKTHLIDKLNKLEIRFNEENMIIESKDCYMNYLIN